MTRILVVEDEAIVAMDLQRSLERLGYQVCGVLSTGEEAVEKAETERPDLVLMDIHLGGEMDGVEAATQIRSRFGIPAIFITAYANGNLIERVKVAEPYGYILKPFKEKEVQTTIEIALYKDRMEKGLHFLQKPFNLEGLLRKVREVLDQ